MNTIDLMTFIDDDDNLYMDSIPELYPAPVFFQSVASPFIFTLRREVILGKYSLKKDDKRFFFHYIASLVRYL